MDSNLFELIITAFELKTSLTIYNDCEGEVIRLSAVLLFEPGAKEIEFIRIKE